MAVSDEFRNVISQCHHECHAMASKGNTGIERIYLLIDLLSSDCGVDSTLLPSLLYRKC